MDTERELGRHFYPGDFVFREGDLADSFFVVQEGVLEGVIVTDESAIPLVRYEKGEIFGEISLLVSDKFRHFSVRAKEESRVLRVDERLFLEKLHVDPSFAFRVMRHMAQRTHDLEMEKRQQILGKAMVSADRPPRQVDDFSVGHHVLLVEDDQDFKELVYRWLGKGSGGGDPHILPGNFQLTWSNSLKQSLHLLTLDKYETVLLDLNLPDSSGLATFRQMMRAVPDTPIVVLSSDEEEDDVLSAVEEGAQDYLLKSKVTGDQVATAICFARIRHQHVLRQRQGAGSETDGWLKKIGSAFGLS